MILLNCNFGGKHSGAVTGRKQVRRVRGDLFDAKEETSCGFLSLLYFNVYFCLAEIGTVENTKKNLDARDDRGKTSIICVIAAKLQQQQQQQQQQRQLGFEKLLGSRMRRFDKLEQHLCVNAGRRRATTVVLAVVRCIIEEQVMDLGRLEPSY
uniref:Uncharacterized protein n=1 Tax=Syphacia muris TaxID=451379 RepID=A0A0N5AYK6_9BILA